MSIRVKDEDLPVAVTVINEQKGRSALPRQFVWSEKFVEIDAEERRFESELRHREHCGTAYIPIEDVADPDSLIDPADRLEATENAESEECELFVANLRDSITGTVRCLPPEIQDVINRFSLPPKQWQKISPRERQQRKQAIQHAINRFYLKHAVHN